ncbi:uncharacterized protein LOC120350827 [Nilaparvata lugens]|uniref:uncharacterized protein LOC120350827 n=1 Tax=Nilaparvata lugens TaxID=108931 RepID=UPI00193E85F0|nr:uncharacterized protein LOC120350827 [Nilaparvata lugens]
MTRVDVDFVIAEGNLWRCPPCSKLRIQGMKAVSAAEDGNPTLSQIIFMLDEKVGKRRKRWEIADLGGVGGVTRRDEVAGTSWSSIWVDECCFKFSELNPTELTMPGSQSCGFPTPSSSSWLGVVGRTDALGITASLVTGSE